MKWLSFLLPAVLAAAPATDGRQEFRTPNGLRVILDERHERPILRLHLLAAWDRTELSEIQADQALRIRSILGRCGAGGVNRAALDRRLADRGIRLDFEGAGDTLAWSMLADSQDQEDAFEILGHVVFRPSLGEDSAGRAEIASGVIPEACFKASLGFPAEGFPHGGLGMEERFSLHRRLVRPEHSVLVIQGDLSLPQARQLVLLHLGTWSPAPEKPLLGATPSLKGDCPAPPEGAWVGSPAPRGDAKDRAAQIAVAILLARVFSQDIQGDILFEASRPGGDAGPFLFGTRSGGDAEKRIRERLEDLCRQGFGQADLVYVRRAWKAEQAGLALHPEDQLRALARTALKGDLGPCIMALREDELNAALRARLAPGALRWLVKKAEALSPK